MQYISSEELIASPKFYLYTPGFYNIKRPRPIPLSDEIFWNCLQILSKARKIAPISPKSITHPAFIEDVKLLLNHFCPSIPIPESEEDLEAGRRWLSNYLEKELRGFFYAEYDEVDREDRLSIFQYLTPRLIRSVHSRKQRLNFHLALKLTAIFDPIVFNRNTNLTLSYRARYLCEYLDTLPTSFLLELRNNPKALDEATSQWLAEGFKAVLDADNLRT